MTIPARRYPLALLLVCSIAYAIIYTGTTSLSTLGDFIGRSFSIGRSHVGAHSAGHLFIGVIGAVLFAILADYKGRRAIFIMALGGFGLFAATAGLVTGYQWYVVSTYLLVLFGTVVYPLAFAELADRWPDRTLASSYGILQAVTFLAFILVALSLMITTYWDWIYVMIGLGIIAIMITAGGFLVFEKAPPLPAENNYYPWRQRAFWHLLTGLMLLMLSLRDIGIFSPSILLKIFNMSSVSTVASTVAILTGVAGAIGAVTGGILSDIFLRRHIKAYTMLPVVGAVITAGCLLALGFVSSSTSALVMLAIILFIGPLTVVTVLTTIMRLSSAQYRTLTAALICVLIPASGTSYAPMLTGLFSGLQWLSGNQSLLPFSIITSIFSAWSVVHFWLAGRAAITALPNKDLESKKPIDPATVKQGIGGWLIIPAIILPVSLLFHIVSIGSVVTLDWSKLEPAHARVLTTNIVLDSVLLLIGSLTTVLFFMKKRTGLLLSRCYFVIMPLATLTLIVITANTVTIPPDHLVHALRPGALGIAIWLPYLLISERVKATFVH